MKKENPSGFSYQKFAQNAGLSSRGFVQEVVSGKKRLTHSSMEKFVSSLALKGYYATLFRMLVCDSDELNYRNWKPDLLSERILNLRSRIRAQTSEPSHSKMVYSRPMWPLIYAALGDGTQGALLTEVSSRTKIPEAICFEHLKEMEKVGVLRWNQKTETYIGKDFHLIHQGNGETRKFFMDSLALVKMGAEKSYLSEENLYFSSVFSVKQERMASFSKKLKELLIEYIEEIEDPSGDQVFTLALGLTSAENHFSV